MSLCTWGCSEDAFLSQNNPNSITPATYWKTFEDFDAALNTVYGALQFNSISGEFIAYEMVRGDLAGTEVWYPHYPFTEFTVTDATEHVQNKWNEAYVGIFRANQVLDKLKHTDTHSLSAEEVSQVEAQARFLRAFFYFELVYAYNGAVIHTTMVEDPQEFNKPFASKAQVLEEVILVDLAFAKEHLPTLWSTTQDKGRVTWGAATAMLGKIALYEQQWAVAEAYFKEIIDSGIYRLTVDIQDNFSAENEFNEESIFEVTFSDALKPGAPGATVDDHQYETAGEATSLISQLSPLSAGGFNTVLPSYYLHELMVYDEMDPANPVNIGFTYSQRMHASIVPVDYDNDYYQEPAGSKTGWAYGQSSYVKKHTNWYDKKLEDAQLRSGINWRHIRYADVLLMYAEAVLEGKGDVNTAIQYIDQVRSRAGVITLQSYMENNGGQFPALHRSVQVHGAHQWVSPTVETVRTHLRKVERPLELCFEGHRWKDLVRWGIVKEVLTDLRADEVWRFDNFEAIQEIPPLRIKERIRPDFAVATDNYDAQTHDYYPIPTNEKQINTALSN
ncbi:RagB/SusD family nutrient uptake outer membrane protein [Algivirga pacifica]|uniref:RagB/SusD family nutrient uptake outer membrane protein n=2 Tax=Algivirga pacifica TaxID=1162670 RepID=A0ABP9CW74_9BACT